jgi:FtsP/CotA-like multicopper oxidase with cupredoxin domain
MIRHLALACIAVVILLVGAPGPARAADAVQPKRFTLPLVNGVVAGASDTIRVKQGDDVELRWSSDKPMELHLHGYDIEAKVGPGKAAVMSFKAKIAGRFPIEPHGQDRGHHRAVTYLEVLP